MAKKEKKELTLEERLKEALVPEKAWPYQIPENWCWTTIEVINDYVPESIDPSLDPEKEFELYSVPSSADDYPEMVLGSEIGSTKQIVEKGDVLLCKINPRINRVWKVSKHTERSLIASSEWIVIRNQHINSGYLMYCLKSQYFRHYLLSNVSGVGGSLMRAQPKYVKKYPVPIPPLSEQYRIVARIESLFAKLDEAKALAQAVVDGFEDRKAAILHKAFTGELTKEWREKNGISLSSWEIVTSTELFSYVTSGSRGWAQYYSDDGAVFIRMGNLDHGTIQLDMTDIQYVKLPDKAEGQRSRIQEGDILISITADVGMVGLVQSIDYEGYINQHIALARPVHKESAEFIAWYLVSDVGFSQLRRKQRGATKVGLGLEDIRSLSLKMPRIDEQEEILFILDKLVDRENQIKEITETVIDQIDVIKKSIFARAFRGELGTNDPSDEPAVELLKRTLCPSV